MKCALFLVFILIFSGMGFADSDVHLSYSEITINFNADNTSDVTYIYHLVPMPNYYFNPMNLEFILPLNAKNIKVVNNKREWDQEKKLKFTEEKKQGFRTITVESSETYNINNYFIKINYTETGNPLFTTTKDSPEGKYIFEGRYFPVLLGDKYIKITVNFPEETKEYGLTTDGKIEEKNTLQRKIKLDYDFNETLIEAWFTTETSNQSTNETTKEPELSSEHYEVELPERYSDYFAEVLEKTEAKQDYFTGLFGKELSGIPVTVTDTSYAGKMAVGLMLSEENKIELQTGLIKYSEEFTSTVLLHETTHYYINNFGNVPLWFNEGMAEFIESKAEKDFGLNWLSNEEISEDCKDEKIDLDSWDYSDDKWVECKTETYTRNYIAYARSEEMINDFLGEFGENSLEKFFERLNEENITLTSDLNQLNYFLSKANGQNTTAFFRERNFSLEDWEEFDERYLEVKELIEEFENNSIKSFFKEARESLEEGYHLMNDGNFNESIEFFDEAEEKANKIEEERNAIEKEINSFKAKVKNNKQNYGAQYFKEIDEELNEIESVYESGNFNSVNGKITEAETVLNTKLSAYNETKNKMDSLTEKFENESNALLGFVFTEAEQEYQNTLTQFESGNTELNELIQKTEAKIEEAKSTHTACLAGTGIGLILIIGLIVFVCKKLNKRRKANFTFP
ncbi:MAG: hypothetical protein ABIA76_01790 [Candidatus Diapherotrites archaeon]